MNWILEFYREHIKVFFDFYRFHIREEKWYKYYRSLPRVDHTDYFLMTKARHWPEEEKEQMRKEAFEERMKEFNKVRWVPRGLRKFLDLDIIDEPVYKPIDEEEVRRAVILDWEAHEIRRKHPEFLG